jgi:glycosyltransferase involved in cell wall biosynthesis
VAPLRYGAGIKGKVVFSLGRGVPCVASPCAAEGMSVRDGSEMLIADDPERFADAVVRLYTDAQLWQAISQAGVSFVRANYSAAAGREHVRAILARSGLAIESSIQAAAG